MGPTRAFVTHRWPTGATTYINDYAMAQQFLLDAAGAAAGPEDPPSDAAERAGLVEMSMKVQEAFGGASSLASVIRDLRHLNKLQNEAKHVWPAPPTTTSASTTDDDTQMKQEMEQNQPKSITDQSIVPEQRSLPKKGKMQLARESMQDTLESKIEQLADKAVLKSQSDQHEQQEQFMEQMRLDLKEFVKLEMEQKRSITDKCMEQMKHEMEQMKPTTDKQEMEQMKLDLKEFVKQEMEQSTITDKHEVEQMKPITDKFMEQMKQEMEQMKSITDQCMEQVKLHQVMKQEMEQMKSITDQMEQMKSITDDSMEQLKLHKKKIFMLDKSFAKQEMEQIKPIADRQMKQMKLNEQMKQEMEQVKSINTDKMEQFHSLFKMIMALSDELVALQAKLEPT